MSGREGWKEDALRKMAMAGSCGLVMGTRCHRLSLGFDVIVIVTLLCESNDYSKDLTEKSIVYYRPVYENLYNSAPSIKREREETKKHLWAKVAPYNTSTRISDLVTHNQSSGKHPPSSQHNTYVYAPHNSKILIRNHDPEAPIHHFNSFALLLFGDVFLASSIILWIPFRFKAAFKPHTPIHRQPIY